MTEHIFLAGVRFSTKSNLTSNWSVEHFMLQTTVGTNYFGHYYLTHLLLDKLIQTQKEDGMARAVFMSSTFEQLGNINWSDLE